MIELQNRSMERHGQRWTFNEIEQLILLYEGGVRWGLIARHLGRSVPTCYQRLQAVKFWYQMPADLWDFESVTLNESANLELKKRL